jgi:acyl-CoA thioesterase FadM
VLGSRDIVWRTAGVYRVADGKIAEAWLVPLDQQSFDRAWAQTRPTPLRLHPTCPSAGVRGKHHARPSAVLEFFEAAFIECWRRRFGQLDATLGANRRLTIGTVNVRYLGPVRCDYELHIAVTLDRITKRSTNVHYDAFVGDTQVAEGTSRYVCLDTDTGQPSPLPDAIATSLWDRTVEANQAASKQY